MICGPARLRTRDEIVAEALKLHPEVWGAAADPLVALIADMIMLGREQIRDLEPERPLIEPDTRCWACLGSKTEIDKVTPCGSCGGIGTKEAENARRAATTEAPDGTSRGSG